jgi:hypothetical protein
MGPPKLSPESFPASRDLYSSLGGKSVKSGSMKQQGAFYQRKKLVYQEQNGTDLEIAFDSVLKCCGTE